MTTLDCTAQHRPHHAASIYNTCSIARAHQLKLPSKLVNIRGKVGRRVTNMQCKRPFIAALKDGGLHNRSWQLHMYKTQQRVMVEPRGMQ